MKYTTRLLLCTASCFAAALALRAAPLASDAPVYPSPDTASAPLLTLAAGVEPTPANPAATATNATLPEGWQAVEVAITREVWVRDSDLNKELDVKPGSIFRAQPKLDAPVFATMTAGDATELRGIQGKWVQILLRKKMTGYINVNTATAPSAATTYVSGIVPPTSSAPAAGSATIAAPATFTAVAAAPTVSTPEPTPAPAPVYVAQTPVPAYVQPAPAPEYVPTTATPETTTTSYSVTTSAATVAAPANPAAPAYQYQTTQAVPYAANQQQAPVVLQPLSVTNPSRAPAPSTTRYTTLPQTTTVTAVSANSYQTSQQPSYQPAPQPTYQSAPSASYQTSSQTTVQAAPRPSTQPLTVAYTETQVVTGPMPAARTFEAKPIGQDAAALPRTFEGTFASTRRAFTPRRPYDYQLTGRDGVRYAYLDLSKVLMTEQFETYVGRTVSIIGSIAPVPDTRDIVIKVDTLQMR